MCSPPCRLMLLLSALERSHWGEFQFQIQCITLGNQRPPPPTTTGHAYKVLYSIKVKWHGSAQVEVVEEEDGWAAKKGVSSYRDCRIKARPHFILHSQSVREPIEFYGDSTPISIPSHSLSSIGVFMGIGTYSYVQPDSPCGDVVGLCVGR